MPTLADAPHTPGFADPVLDSQRVFRAVLEAMARPGTVVAIPAVLDPPAPLDRATGALLLCLADHDTPVWLDAATANPQVEAWIRFHCGCPLVAEPAEAAFAVIADPLAMPPLPRFHPGSDEYPDRSATLFIKVPSLHGGEPLTLQGPGIRDHAQFPAAGFPPQFKEWVRANHELFPRGVDLVFACGSQIAALPRSTRLGGA